MEIKSVHEFVREGYRPKIKDKNKSEVVDLRQKLVLLSEATRGEKDCGLTRHNSGRKGLRTHETQLGVKRTEGSRSEITETKLRKRNYGNESFRLNRLSHQWITNVMK
ncbi:MAG: hypothetical protein WCB90_03295 [Methanosarcina sp.]